MLICIPIIILPLKKWLFLTYDEEGAITSGIKAPIYHHLFFVILCLLIVTSIKLAGTVLVETMLLVPGFFALKFSRSVKQTFLFSVIFSTSLSILGIIISNSFGLPSGATLAFVLFFALVLSLFVKKIYNLIKR